MGYTLRRPQGSKAWHCYFLTRDVERFRKSTKQSDKRRADVVASDWYRRFADPAYRAAHETSIEDASRRLREALVNRGRSPATIGFYEEKLSHVGRVMGADLPLVRISAATVDDYIATRKHEGASANTVSKELTAIRMLLKHARRRGEFDKELSQVMPIGFSSGYKPRERRITIEQAWSLINELPPNVARYAAFVCATTARDRAVSRARGRDLTEAGIAVHDKKTKRAARIVPLNAVTEDFAFFAFKGVSPDAMVAPGISSVRHAFDRACKRLKLAHISPNDLRRSVAHWLLERGAPRDVVSAFMGHANTKMLDMVYGKLDAGEVGEALNRSLGSTLDGSWKNEANPVDTVDAVDPSSTEKTVHRGRIELPTRGFSIRTGPPAAPGKRSTSGETLDPAWIDEALAVRIARLRAEAATDEEIARRFHRGVALAKAGKREESDRNLRELSSLLLDRRSA